MQETFAPNKINIECINPQYYEVRDEIEDETNYIDFNFNTFSNPSRTFKWYILYPNQSIKKSSLSSKFSRFNQFSYRVLARVAEIEKSPPRHI